MKMLTILQKKKKNPKPAFKVLLNSRLEIEVQRIVHSFNFALHLFFSSKYYIRNNHIYPRGNLYTAASFFYILMMIVVYFQRAFTKRVSDMLMKKIENDFASLCSAFLFILQSVCLIILFCVDIENKQNNLNLILKIQTIYKRFNFKKNIRSYVLWNYVSIISFICLDIYCLILFVRFRMYVNYADFASDIACDIAYLSFDINYIVAIRIIIFLKKYLVEWIKEIMAFEDNENNNELCQKLLDTYQDILEAYNLYKIIFRVLVS